MRQTQIYIFTAPGPSNQPDPGPGSFSDPLLAQAAQRYTQLGNAPTAPADWQVERPRGGKPYFPYRPDIQFSLSHSGAFWVCALAQQPVGLDLQQHRPCPRQALARRFFSPEECAYLQNRDAPDFFRIWAAKESYVKYTGEGITSRFSQFFVAGPDGLLDRVQGAQLRFLPGPSGYSLCLCAPAIQTVTFYSLAEK